MSSGVALFATLALLVRLPDDMSEAESAELLHSCTATVQPDACTLASPNEPSDAHIEQLSYQRYLLELEVTSDEKTRSVSREIIFSQADAPLDRAQALGLSLGLMARSLNEKDATPASVQKPEPSQTSKEKMESSSKRQATSQPEEQPSKLLAPATPQLLLLGGAGFVFDPSLSRPFVGPSLSAWLLVGSHLAITANATMLFGSWPRQDNTLKIRRIAPSVGLVVLGTGHRLSYGLELDVGVENLRAQGAGLQSAASHYSVELCASTPVAWYLSTHWLLQGAFQLGISPSPTRILIDDAAIGTAGYINPGARISVGYAF